MLMNNKKKRTQNIFEAKWKENLENCWFEWSKKNKKFTKNILDFCTRAFAFDVNDIDEFVDIIIVQKTLYFISHQPKKYEYFVICCVYGKSVILIHCVMGNKHHTHQPDERVKMRCAKKTKKTHGRRA